MIRRLTLLSFLLAAIVLAPPHPVAASPLNFPNGVTFDCFPIQYEGQNVVSCVMGFPVLTFVGANYDTQHESEWCWAASLEMALSSLGHRVSQQRIVAAAYGAPVNWSASVQTIEDVANSINQDDAGNSISVELTDRANPDPSKQLHGIEAAFSRGHPVLLALPTHVVVLSAMNLFATGPDGMDLTYRRGRIEDPWPADYGTPGGPRVMEPEEYATVQHVWEVSVQ